MKLKLLGNRILIRHSYETVSKGGIALPESAHIKSLGSFVVAVGDGDKVHPDVKPGAQVVVNPFGGQDVMWEGQQLKMIGTDDVLAIVQTEPVLQIVGADT